MDRFVKLSYRITGDGVGCQKKVDEYYDKSNNVLYISSPKSAYKCSLLKYLNVNSHRKKDEYTGIPECMKYVNEDSCPVSYLVKQDIRKKKCASVLNTAYGPERVLDAPGYLDDFYLKLIDWGHNGMLAVGLGSSVYLWNSLNKEVSELMDLGLKGATNGKAYVSSVKWVNKSTLAIGSSRGYVELWDIRNRKVIKGISDIPNDSVSRDNDSNRVSSIAFEGNVLVFGTKTGNIFRYDMRDTMVHKYERAHFSDICGLSFSGDGDQMSSGGNDNMVKIWDPRSLSRCLFEFDEHRAAVKAMAWCSWQRGLLASGGGIQDQSIKTWNTLIGRQLNSYKAGAQVTSLIWSPEEYREIVSAHGHGINGNFRNRIVVWSYPSMVKVNELKSHSSRILEMCNSPNERTVVTVGADENIHFWNLFPKTKDRQRSGYENNFSLYRFRGQKARDFQVFGSGREEEGPSDGYTFLCSPVGTPLTQKKKDFVS